MMQLVLICPSYDVYADIQQAQASVVKYPTIVKDQIVLFIGQNVFFAGHVRTSIW